MTPSHPRLARSPVCAVSVRSRRCVRETAASSSEKAAQNPREGWSLPHGSSAEHRCGRVVPRGRPFVRWWEWVRACARIRSERGLRSSGVSWCFLELCPKRKRSDLFRRQRLRMVSVHVRCLVHPLGRRVSMTARRYPAAPAGGVPAISARIQAGLGFDCYLPVKINYQLVDLCAPSGTVSVGSAAGRHESLAAPDSEIFRSPEARPGLSGCRSATDSPRRWTHPWLSAKGGRRWNPLQSG